MFPLHGFPKDIGGVSSTAQMPPGKATLPLPSGKSHTYTAGSRSIVTLHVHELTFQNSNTAMGAQTGL